MRFLQLCLLCTIACTAPSSKEAPSTTPIVAATPDSVGFSAPAVIEQKEPAPTSAPDRTKQMRNPIPQRTSTRKQPSRTTLSKTTERASTEHVQSFIEEAQATTAVPKAESTITSAPTQANTNQETAASVNHQVWSDLLKKHVSDRGQVNYKAFLADIDGIKGYLAQAEETVPDKSWSRSEAMAYWINVYNAATVLLILENYPLKSIMDLDGGKTWDVKRIKLGGKNYSLNQIENDILRPQYKDARIHFAVNCAAKGCPPLLNEAFLPETLDAQLTARTKAFIRNKSFNTISATEAKVSKIFDWYGADFGDLRTYLNKYGSVSLNEGAAISFQNYDWSLNGN